MECSGLCSLPDNPALLGQGTGWIQKHHVCLLRGSVFCGITTFQAKTVTMWSEGQIHFSKTPKSPFCVTHLGSVIYPFILLCAPQLWPVLGYKHHEGRDCIHPVSTVSPTTKKDSTLHRVDSKHLLNG